MRLGGTDRNVCATRKFSLDDALGALPRRSWFLTMRRFAIDLSLLCITLGAVPNALGIEEPTTIPTTGRPWHVPFSEASGQFRIAAVADTNALRVEQPLLLRVRIMAQGAIHQPPQRINLAELPTFTQSFYIENIETADKQLDPQTWEFVYRLKPRSAKVQEIPSIPLAFYDPDIPFPESRFQIDYSDPLPLKVLPARTFEFERPPLPESVYAVPDASQLLERRGPPEPPSIWLTSLLLIAPPLLCLGWYQAWRRYWPSSLDADRRQRSRAAKEALRMLEEIDSLPPVAAATRAAAALTNYLRQRLGLPAEEPTPAEVADRVRNQGCSDALAAQTATIYEQCDAIRFSESLSRMPDTKDNTNLCRQATRLVLELEEATCRTSDF